jgi:alkaline phosphatase D
MRAKYDQQLAHAEYQALLAYCPVIGTWDDHDYGDNNAGKEYPKKQESKAEMLRFLDVPSDREVWQRKGAYDAYTYESDGRTVKVILLDTRYFRDQPGQSGTILGDAQWQWFEEQLTTAPAEVNLIVSSIQFLAEDHRHEKWANFPAERQRMLDMLVEHQVSHPIFISGDRHIAEISKMEVEGLSVPVYDITSSGMTHSWENADEPNQHRISELIGQKNFGKIRFDWTNQKAVMEIRGLENVVYAREQIDL